MPFFACTSLVCLSLSSGLKGINLEKHLRQEAELCILSTPIPRILTRETSQFSITRRSTLQLQLKPLSSPVLPLLWVFSVGLRNGP
ncbi:hypothetical protein DL96DRAFT_143477 [Flagelloscypha sp. PMI_526]|nr:hypothetical protein DL96DRAFT_143477 [Flagelloscypha sp. PMI_526]